MRALTIFVIVSVAVIMGMSAVVPMIPQAYAEHPCKPTLEQFNHACGPEQKPTCEEIADKMREKGVPRDAIERFLEHCVP